MGERAAALWDIARTFLKIGAVGFGGPAIIGLMQQQVQEVRRWMTREQFVDALGVVNLLPGPVAAQLAIFVGHAKAGAAGGVIAGLAFMLPGFLVITALAGAYGTFAGEVPVRRALFGAGAVVIGIFAAAVYRLGRGAIKSRSQALICACAALALASGIASVATVLFLAGCAGVALFRSAGAGALAATAVIAADLAMRRIGWTNDLLIASAPSAGPSWLQLATLFFEVGALTFGGGLSIIAFLQEAVVGKLQWLSTQEFLDGLAIGQLTPGPVLMLAAFVGYSVMGLAGAVAAAAAVFLPSFVMMLAVLPLLERFGNLRWLKAAMSGIGPAVIGVLFVSLVQLAWQSVHGIIPVVLILGSCAAMLLWNVGALTLLAAGALIGVLLG